jgi:uncharacterized protein with WD repeat
LAVLLVAAPVRAGDIGEIRCVQFSPAGRLAAFASNTSVKLWDTATNRKAGELKGHTEDITALVFAPDGKTLYTAGRDKTVRQWDLATGKETHKFDSPTDGVLCLAISADGKRLAAGSADHKIWVWDTGTGKEVQQFKKHDDEVLYVALSPDGKTASSSNDFTVRLWNTDTGEPLSSIAAAMPTFKVRVGLFTPDGSQLVTTGTDQVVRVWDAKKGTEVRNFSGHQGAVLCMALSPDGHTLATGARDATLRLWDLPTGRELKTIECHLPGVLSVAFSPDGHSVISGGYDCNVKLWETATGKPRLEYKADTSPVKPLEALTAAQLEAHWKALEGEDSLKAYDAVLALSGRPQEAVPFLQKQLKASDVKIDAKQIQKWIKELDDEDFSTRENAQTQLQKQGRAAIVPLQNALGKTKSVEMQRRLEEIIKVLEKNDVSSQALLETRALEVLENANTPESRKVLETLAGGTAEAELTVRAKAALARLAKKPALK